MCVSEPGSCEHNDYLEWMRKSANKLVKQMRKAIKRNDVAGVEFLLKAGVPVNTDIEIGPFRLTLMGYALTKNLEIAKLLRKYRALFVFSFEDDFRGCRFDESARYIVECHASELVPGAADWLLDNGQPRAGSEPLPTYWDDFKATKNDRSWRRPNPSPKRIVHTSWPPNVSLEGCTESMKTDIKSFWYNVGEVRQIESWHNVKLNWRVFRLMMRMRGIAMFWLRVTQENGCEPEGVLRKRDREAYEEADMFS